jgi:hypothetical protein
MIVLVRKPVQPHHGLLSATREPPGPAPQGHKAWWFPRRIVVHVAGSGLCVCEHGARPEPVDVSPERDRGVGTLAGGPHAPSHSCPRTPHGFVIETTCT